MSEAYFVNCSCGNRIRVELFDAGTTTTCRSCNAMVTVPNTSTLKELSGDKYPLLRPIDKVLKTLETREPPFDGLCHGCSNADAVFQLPVQFDALRERQVADDGGIRPTIRGEINFVAGAALEYWQTTRFPLLLCKQCHANYQTNRSRAKSLSYLKLACVMGLFAGFLYFAYYNAEVIAGAVGLLTLIGAIAWAMNLRQDKKSDRFVTKWAGHIRWVPEAIAAEQEYKLTIGESRSFDRSAALIK